MLEIHTGGVLGDAPEKIEQTAVGQRDLQPQHEVAHGAVADDPVAAGVGGGVAAHLAGAARAEVEGKGPTFGFDMLLQDFERDAGLHQHGAAYGVEVFDGVEPGKREHDLAGLWGGAAGEAGEAALDSDGLAMLMAQAEGAGHLPWRTGEQDDRRLYMGRLAPIAGVGGVAGRVVRDGIVAQKRREGDRKVWRERGVVGR